MKKIVYSQHKQQRNQVYNYLAYVVINCNARLTMETRKQADNFFRDEILSRLKGYKQEEKKKYFRYLFHALKEACYWKGCVQIDRDNSKQQAAIRLQIIEVAKQTGLFTEYRSKPGSPKMSRLVPTSTMKEMCSSDPWSFDPDVFDKYVYLYKRDEEDVEIPFDPSSEVPTNFQSKLYDINGVNSQYTITYHPYNEWEDRLSTQMIQIRPIHYARFLDNFDNHGRLYTGKYGHQSLMKRERASIEFNGEPSVEFDYSGLHPRMLYHLEGIDYRSDPYALWKEKTTPPMRLMAKQFLTALINAENEQAAIGASNRTMSTFNKEGGKKNGKSLTDARRMLNAQQETELKFSEMLPTVKKYHPKILHRLHADLGIKLMRMDSEIALNVLHSFAQDCVPCLGIHDSFIVPRYAASELRRVMLKTYKDIVGFLPVVK